MNKITSHCRALLWLSHWRRHSWWTNLMLPLQAQGYRRGLSASPGFLQIRQTSPSSSSSSNLLKTLLLVISFSTTAAAKDDDDEEESDVDAGAVVDAAEISSLPPCTAGAISIKYEMYQRRDRFLSESDLFFYGRSSATATEKLAESDFAEMEALGFWGCRTGMVGMDAIA